MEGIAGPGRLDCAAGPRVTIAVGNTLIQRSGFDLEDARDVLILTTMGPSFLRT